MDTPDKTPPPADDGALDMGVEARIEALMDGKGYSYALARAAVTGATEELFPPQEAGPPNRVAVARTSRRGGRSYPEPSARDLAAAEPYVQPTDKEVAERQATTEHGRQTVERSMETHNFEQDIETARKLGISVEAATQLRLNKQERRRRELRGE